MSPLFFFFNDTATTEIYTLSLHDALPISAVLDVARCTKELLGFVQRVRVDAAGEDLAARWHDGVVGARQDRSEEHTSELQSPCNLVCRLLLEKKKKKR